MREWRGVTNRDVKNLNKKTELQKVCWMVLFGHLYVFWVFYSWNAHIKSMFVKIFVFIFILTWWWNLLASMLVLMSSPSHRWRAITWSQFRLCINSSHNCKSLIESSTCHWRRTIGSNTNILRHKATFTEHFRLNACPYVLRSDMTVSSIDECLSLLGELVDYLCSSCCDFSSARRPNN